MPSKPLCYNATFQDQISVAFDPAPPFYTTLLEWPGLRPFPDAPRRILKRHIFGYIMAVLFRYSILLPVRLSLCLTSFLFCFLAVIYSYLFPLTRKQQLRISVIYCRLFCAGIGLVARYHNKQYRPKKPGIAVSNHLSPNDIQVIFADIDLNTSSGCGYTVTGQKHTGIIWAIERLVEKLCPALWLERSNADDRRRFMREVLVVCQTRLEDPVLMFPEGYCTNNTRILQFRRAVFEENVTIYPIAIKTTQLYRQSARFGDSFWSEDYFWQYLLRVFTSWAIAYDVYYLKPMERQTPETAQEFASRVQREIAKYADAEPLDFDGRLWYNSEERERLKDLQMQNVAKRIIKLQESDQTEL
uniref:PlsC domain-containing protein n=1 Tax=Syphacia muris TaxID=451379 RepID=A0A0N5ASF8_9BILA